MKIINLKCSSCGSGIEVDASLRKGFCQYCGTPFAIEAENENKVVDVNGLLKSAIDAERSGNYPEAIKLYDKALDEAPDRPEAVIGKAFVSLTVFSLGKINVKFFQSTLNKGIDLLNQQNVNVQDLYGFILDKSWSVMSYLLEKATNAFIEGARANPNFAANLYIENLTLMHDAQMIVSNIVENNPPTNPDKMYVDGYIELKKTIVAHSNFILTQAKKYNAKIEKSKLKEIKTDAKISKKKLKEFKKMYA